MTMHKKKIMIRLSSALALLASSAVILLGLSGATELPAYAPEVVTKEGVEKGSGKVYARPDGSASHATSLTSGFMIPDADPALGGRVYAFWSSRNYDGEILYSYSGDQTRDGGWVEEKHVIAGGKYITTSHGVEVVTFKVLEGTQAKDKVCLFVKADGNEDTGSIQYTCGDAQIDQQNIWSFQNLPALSAFRPKDRNGNVMTLTTVTSMVSATPALIFEHPITGDLVPPGTFYLALSYKVDKGDYLINDFICNLDAAGLLNCEQKISNLIGEDPTIYAVDQKAVGDGPESEVRVIFFHDRKKNDKIYYVTNHELIPKAVMGDKEKNTRETQKRPAISRAMGEDGTDWFFLAWKNESNKGIRAARISVPELLGFKENWEYCQLEPGKYGITEYLYQTEVAPYLIAYPTIVAPSVYYQQKGPGLVYLWWRASDNDNKYSYAIISNFSNEACKHYDL